MIRTENGAPAAAPASVLGTWGQLFSRRVWLGHGLALRDLLCTFLVAKPFLRAGLAILLVAGSMMASAKEIVRISIGEWPPYLSQNLPHYGVAAHLVQVAFNAVGMDVEFNFFPWKRAFANAESGDFDASILWVETEERARTLLFSDVLVTGEGVFFYNKNNPLIWKDYKDLDGKRFGGLLSASYPWVKAAKSQGVNVQMELVAYESQNFSKLLSGRIDAFSLDKLVGLYILQQQFPDQRKLIDFDPTPIESWPYRVIFPRNERGKALVKAFNEGLAIIKQRGLIQAYLNNVSNGAYLPAKSKP